MSTPVLAAEKERVSWEGWDKFNLDVGVFFPTQSTQLRLDSSDGLSGALLDWEDGLGLDNRQKLPRVDGLWRYGRRSSVRFSYFDLSRDTLSPLTVTFRWGDVVFDPTTTQALRTVLDLEILQGSWGYSFFRRPRWDARVTLGLFAMKIRASLTDPQTQVGDEGDVLAPLPVFGLGFDHKLTGKWCLGGHVQIFSITVDDYSGELVDAMFTATHDTFKNVGFGIGYNFEDLDIIATKKDYRGELHIDYRGFFAYVRLRLWPGT
ncbi:MAG: hypothetical protein ACE5H7_17955 [Acidiferrobacterales bacterium]